MPIDFPDMSSLKSAALIHNFRPPMEGELEHVYRNALADHVRPIDLIESDEIRYGVGWDRWTDKQKRESLMRNI
jgi:hypothetical protein